MSRKYDFHWNVLSWDMNKDELVPYDVGSTFINEFKSLSKKERDSVNVEEFLDSNARYHFWAKCEYEMVCTGWPKSKNEHKLDVYEQLKANWDNFVKTFKMAIS